MQLNLSFGQRFQQFIPSSINLRSKGGFVIAHRPNMSHLPEKNTFGFELEFAQQDLTRTGWTEVYKNPMRGLSLSYQNFGNKEVLGEGYALFAHTTFPLFQSKRFGFLDYRSGTGIAYLTKKYDIVANPKNNAIGTNLNGYVNLSIQWHKYFGHWHIGAALELAHYSNSAFKVPNLGLNIPSIMFNVGYDVVKRETYSANREYVDFEHYNTRMASQIRIFAIGSAKQNVVRYNPPKSRPVIAIQGMYSMPIGRRWKFDVGIDGIFNGGNQWHLDTTAYSVGETIQFGAFVGASLHAYRAEFLTGIGVYFWSPVKPFGLIYNRLGFRYHFTDNISGIIGIKSHLAIADYLEIGIGYSIWRKD